MIDTISDKNFQTRISNVYRKCNSIYDNCTELWIENAPYVNDLVLNKDIVEIGCGPYGGLAKNVFELGAKSYLGIDINNGFVETSKRMVPNIHNDFNVEFIWDDPIYVLNNISKPVTCISSGVIDWCILVDKDYTENLIKAMSNATPIGGHSIHWAYMLNNEYGSLFQKYGFKSLERGLHQLYNAKFGANLTSNFEAYERVK